MSASIGWPRALGGMALAASLCAVQPDVLSAQATTSGAAPTERRITVIDDIPYRSGPSPAWRLDMAVPEDFGGELRPAIVIIHGGGWRAGSRRDRPYRSMLLDYALKGYVTVSIDYRLTGEAPFPAAVEDVDCAVRWLRAHAAEYRVDPDRIGAYGHSAGAHLALLLAVAPFAPPLESDCEWRDQPATLTSVVGGSTPPVLPANVGDTRLYSPASYVSSEMIPLLLIHGTEDNVVPVETVDEYVDSLRAANVPDLTYLRIEGGNHGVAYEHYLERSMAAITEFFGRTLMPE